MKRETRKIKRQCWETFVSRIEHDLQGQELNAYKVIRNLNKTEKHNLEFNPVTEHTWLDYYRKLWTKHPIHNTTEEKSAKLTEKCVDLITMEELDTIKKTLKSKNLQEQTG
jgi:hypothetical protein